MNRLGCALAVADLPVETSNRGSDYSFRAITVALRPHDVESRCGPWFDKLTMRFKPLKTRGLILSLSKDEAGISALDRDPIASLPRERGRALARSFRDAPPLLRQRDGGLLGKGRAPVRGVALQRAGVNALRNRGKAEK